MYSVLMSSLKRLVHATIAAAALFGTAPALVGCGQLAGGLESAKAVNAEVEEELGLKVHTNFEITDGDTSVTVTLPDSPDSTSAQTHTKVIEIVRKHFPDAKEIEIKQS